MRWAPCTALCAHVPRRSRSDAHPRVGVSSLRLAARHVLRGLGKHRAGLRGRLQRLPGGQLSREKALATFSRSSFRQRASCPYDGILEYRFR
eukprot:6039391-Pleurochrysis_carterae.AAC.1